MNKEWNLDILYKGLDDPKFKEDFKKIDELIEESHALAASLESLGEDEGVLKIVAYLEKADELERNVFEYLSLRSSTCTTDPEVTALIGQLMDKLTGVTKDRVMFQKFIGKVADIDALVSRHEELKEYSYMLNEMKKNVKHMLADDVEDMFAKMDITSGSAWGDMFGYLTSTVKVDYKGGVETLSSIRAMAHDKDPEVRKSAYEAEIAAYEKIEAPIAYALNNIKKQANMISKERGFDSALAWTLEQSRMSQETLDALWGAIQGYLPKFHAYMRRKGEILGHKNGLPWYDMFAPLGKGGKTYTTEEARDMLVDLFGNFSDDMAQMMKDAFDNEWIDFFPREGKVGGAFCANVPSRKQSRILTNFTGSLADIDTLAHELGHAYHGMMIEDQRPLNQDYSMPVAETASTFNENVFLNFVTDKATGDEKIALLDSQITEVNQTICDIYSRFLFESAVFEGSKEQFLFPEQLKELMLDAQQKAYGDGLDPEVKHPYMWACKGHYYSAGLNYYNFPYAFGALFSKGLYAMYKEEGPSFVPKYREMLKATTTTCVEDTAKVMGIDLTKQDFWKNSLELISQDIDEFLRLTEK